MSEKHIAELTEAEATLRLIAKLPAPEDLAARVEARLQRERATSSQVLSWPTRPRRAWLPELTRSAAAASIVAVVAGGAWQISLRVPPATGSAGKSLVARPAAGSFSNAGAMRIPATVNAPVLKHPPQKPAQKKADSAKKKPDTAQP